jgi:hypothetical protein
MRWASSSERAAEVSGGSSGLPGPGSRPRAAAHGAVQDKVWAGAPGGEPWEVYVVKADADAPAESAHADGIGAPGACCGATACCTPDERALDPDRTPAEAKAASGCTCASPGRP